MLYFIQFALSKRKRDLYENQHEKDIKDAKGKQPVNNPKTV
jgi:hypothetical protein